MDLNQVTLPVTDVERSAAFYRRMGFTQIVEAPHYARFECPVGGATFSLHRAEEGVDDRASRGGGGVVLYFECEELDRRVAELEERGFRFVQRPRVESWLWREARLLDPDGNQLCLYHAGENRRFPPWRVELRDRG